MPGTVEDAGETAKNKKRPGSSCLMQDILVLDKGTNKKNILKRNSSDKCYAENSNRVI